MITLSNADAALKDYYLDAVNAQLSGEVSPFFNAIEKTTENVFGKDVKILVSRGSMDGVVAGKEDGDLPAPHSNRYYGLTMPLKNIYGTIEISDKAIRASENSAGAFVNLLNAEMEGLVAGAKANFARMLYSDGSGYLCTVSSGSGTTYTVDSVKSYFKGLKVVCDGHESDVVTIDDVNPSSNTIKFKETKSYTLSYGTKIRLAGAADNELTGLEALFDDSSAKLYGYDRSSDSFFRPCIRRFDDDVSETDVIDMIDYLEELSDGKVNMILCSHKMRRKLAELMSTSRRIVNTSEINAGYSSVIINDVPVFADKYCPEDRIYFVNTNDFVLNQLCDWSWLEDEGGRVLKQVAGKAAYTATLVKYAELVCKKPYAQGLIKIER